MRLEATFTLEKETTGTVRYQEDAPDDNPVVGTLYVKKSALRGERPRRLTVVIEAED